MMNFKPRVEKEEGSVSLEGSFPAQDKRADRNRSETRSHRSRVRVKSFFLQDILTSKGQFTLFSNSSR